MTNDATPDYAINRMLIEDAANYTSIEWKLNEIDECGFLSIPEIDAALVQAADLVLEGDLPYLNVDRIMALVTADVPKGLESDIRDVTNVMRLMYAPKDTFVVLERDRHTVLRRGRCVRGAQSEVEAFLGRPFHWEKVDQNDFPHIRDYNVTRYVALAVPDWKWTAEDAELALEVGDEESFWLRREMEGEDECEAAKFLLNQFFLCLQYTAWYLLQRLPPANVRGGPSSGGSP